MLTFASPLFLLGGIALGIPVALHLLKRQVPLRLVFPSVRFIKKGKLPKQGRRRLRDIFLLLFRLALFASLVFLFARPEWKGGSPAVAALKKRNAVIFIDWSPSMSGWKKPAKIRIAVEKILGSSPDTVWSLYVSGGGHGLVLASTTDQSKIMRAVSELSPNMERCDQARNLETLINYVVKEKIDTVYLISDFQAGDWRPASLPSLPVGVALHLVDIPPENERNIAIMDANSRRLPEGKSIVTATIKNFGETERKAFLTLKTDVEKVGKPVTIPARGQIDETLVVKAGRNLEGTLSLSRNMEGDHAKNDRKDASSFDDYTLDDNYKCWLGGVRPTRILVAIPKEEPVQASAFLFIQKAFLVNTGQSRQHYVVQPVDSEYFHALDLEDADAIFLLGACGYFNEQAFERLRQFIERGGFVFYSPGASAGHALIGLRKHGVFAASYKGLQKSFDFAESCHVDWLDKRSFLGNLFKDSADTDLFLFPIHKMIRLSVESPAEILLKTNHDYPFLSRQLTGSGWLYVSSVGMTPDWSDLPLTHSFLPLIREMTLQALRSREQGVEKLSCGDSFPRKAVVRGKKTNVDTSAPAVVVVADTPYEINVDRRESILERRMPLLIKKRLCPKKDDESTREGVRLSAASAHTLVLWPFFAVLAAFLSLVELLVAWRN